MSEFYENDNVRGNEPPRNNDQGQFPTETDDPMDIWWNPSAPRVVRPEDIPVGMFPPTWVKDSGVNEPGFRTRSRVGHEYLVPEVFG